MQKDLFGKKVKPKRKDVRLKASLNKYDKTSFPKRLERLRFINKIFPKGYGFGASIETVYIFDEAKMAFINGELISTILLAQAFIERLLQAYYSDLNLDEIGRRGLKSIIDHAKRNNTVDEFLLKKIDMLRKKRNPFVHLKDYEHEFNLSQRMYKAVKEKKEFKPPLQIIEDDAKEAIQLMYAVFQAKL